MTLPEPSGPALLGFSGTGTGETTGAWVLSYCESYNLALHRPGLNGNSDKIESIDKAGQSKHGDPVAAFLEILHST